MSISNQGPSITLSKITRRHQPIIKYQENTQNHHPLALWQNSEKLQMLFFLKTSQSTLSLHKNKFPWIFFIRMAKEVKTRNFRQCKIYFQRLFKKTGTLQNLIKFLEISIKPQVIVKSETDLCPNQQKSKNQKQKQMNIKEEESNFETKVKIEDCNEHPVFFQYELMGDYRNCSMAERWNQCHKLYLRWVEALQEMVRTEIHKQ